MRWRDIHLNRSTNIFLVVVPGEHRKDHGRCVLRPSQARFLCERDDPQRMEKLVDAVRKQLNEKSTDRPVKLGARG